MKFLDQHEVKELRAELLALYAAVMERAWLDLNSATKGTTQADLQDAEAWVQREGDASPFSFSTTCTVLGIEEGWIKEKLLSRDPNFRRYIRRVRGVGHRTRIRLGRGTVVRDRRYRQL